MMNDDDEDDDDEIMKLISEKKYIRIYIHNSQNKMASHLHI